MVSVTVVAVVRDAETEAAPTTVNESRSGSVVTTMSSLNVNMTVLSTVLAAVNMGAVSSILTLDASVVAET